MNLPNLLSVSRMLATPVMLLLAWQGRAGAFLLLMLAAWCTDALDGWLARRRGQCTALGAWLDSAGDLAFYTALSLGAWWLWPERVRAEGLAVGMIVASFLLPPLAGLFKFRHLTSYHTRAAKVAAVLTATGVVALLSLDFAWPLRMAAVICLYAGLEEIAITLKLQGPRADIPSYWRL